MNEQKEEEKEKESQVIITSAPEAEWILLPPPQYHSDGFWPAPSDLRVLAQAHPALALGSVAMILAAVTIQPLLLLVCVPFPLQSRR